MLWLLLNDFSGTVYLWQPVDAGYAATLKRLIAVEQQKILITHWAGEAWKALNTSKYDKQRKKCWTMTGCLMTSNGSEDSLFKPEGLDSY